MKSPYDFRFIDKKITTEKQLEDELAANITRFLLELGQGFAYVGRQMELKMPKGQTFVPDMIFYHTRLKSYIVCELKVVPFIPDFAGRLNFYDQYILTASLQSRLQWATICNNVD